MATEPTVAATQQEVTEAREDAADAAETGPLSELQEFLSSDDLRAGDVYQTLIGDGLLGKVEMFHHLSDEQRKGLVNLGQQIDDLPFTKTWAEADRTKKGELLHSDERKNWGKSVRKIFKKNKSFLIDVFKTETAAINAHDEPNDDNTVEEDVQDAKPAKAVKVPAMPVSPGGPQKDPIIQRYEYLSKVADNLESRLLDIQQKWSVKLAPNKLGWAERENIEARVQNKLTREDRLAQRKGTKEEQTKVALKVKKLVAIEMQNLEKARKEFVQLKQARKKALQDRKELEAKIKKPRARAPKRVVAAKPIVRKDDLYAPALSHGGSYRTQARAKSRTYDGRPPAGARLDPAATVVAMQNEMKAFGKWDPAYTKSKKYGGFMARTDTAYRALYGMSVTGTPDNPARLAPEGSFAAPARPW